MTIHERGLSLADILVALAIFAVAFLALLGLYPMGMRSVAQAQAMVGATFLAEQVLETERNLDFEQIVSRGPVKVEPERLQALKRQGGETSLDYEYSVLVTDLDDGITPAGKSILVQVDWNRGDGLKSVQLETEVSQ